MKKVQVQMSDECHAVLKDFANAWDMTMSEVLYECTRQHIHRSSESCPYIGHLFKFKRISQDKRLDKDCYGHKCFGCKYVTSCRTGLYKGEYEMSKKASALFESYH